jgi:hypothetical protein
MPPYEVDMTWLFLSLGLSALLAIGVPLSHVMSQKLLDRQRITYRITFPADVKQTELLNWLRQISSTLTGQSLMGLPTMVFETWADDREIIHTLSLPWQDADYIINQLQGLMPGVGTIKEQYGRPHKEWTYATEYGIRQTQLPITIKDPQSMANSTLMNLNNIRQGESVLLQWIVTPTSPPRRTMVDGLIGIPQPSKEAQDALKLKFEEPNFIGTFRIGAMAETKNRAKHLVALTHRPMKSTGRFGRVFHWTSDKVVESLTLARTPYKQSAQVSAAELMPFLSWPLGSPLIAGLPQGVARHLPPTEAIAREGIQLGQSTYPGRERVVAMTPTAMTTHTFIGGLTGVGKTTLMGNMATQVMEAGHGLVVLEAKGDLFHEVLDRIPPNRLDEAIIIDFTDGLKPVGFNILDQGNPRTVIDELVELFQHKYADKGVWFRELMFHGLMTLHEYPGMTFNDLSTLVSPKDDEEAAWAKKIIAGVKDRELKKFWHRWKALSENDRRKHAEVVESRIWQLIGRIEPRYLFGQSQSSFQAEDVIRGNKILLINLAGVPKESAEIVGTLMLNALWGAAQRVPATLPNHLFMDEFQMFANLPMGFDDVLALARKYQFCVTSATQYVERLPENLKQAIRANARNKIIFQSSAGDAAIWQREFGSRSIEQAELVNLKAHMAVARLNTDTGISSPVTIKTFAPRRPTGVAREVVQRSNMKYGRSIVEIQQEEALRREPPANPQKRPSIGKRKLT